jgi:hypothetical protein
MRLLLAILILPMSLMAQSIPPITLAWDHSPSADVTGYKIYWKTNATMTNFVFQQAVSRTNTVVVINASSHTTTNMPAAQVTLNVGWVYAFHVTATNAVGLESDPTNIVIFSAPMKPLSPSGLRIYVEWSTNLVTWVPAEIMLPGQQQLAYFRLKVSE